MDYYLILGHGVLAEQFVRRNDFSTAGLRSSDGRLSRLIRTDPALSVAAVAPGDPIPLRDYTEFPSAPLLTLASHPPLPGFREKRLYRVLFARTPPEPTVAGEEAEGADRFEWRLRAIGDGVAWGLDVTAHLHHGTTVGAVLDRLTDHMRLRHRLIPLTTERFY